MEEYYFYTEGLTVGYHGVPLIKNIKISLKKGEILTLIGPNGAGKTTILRSIIKQLKPLGGVVVLDGKETEQISGKELSRKLSVVLTERVRPEMMTCKEVVATGRYPYTGKFGVLSKEDWKLVDEAMELVHIHELADRDFSKTSDGQKQRVMLARAICQQPDIIILDEPTAALTRNESEKLYTLVDKLKENGVSIIFISHRFEDMYRLASRVTVFRDSQYIGTYDVNGITNADLIKAMVGREINDLFPKPEVKLGDEMLRIEHLSRTGFFKDVSFNVHAGEIVGLTGLVGAGRTEVMEAVCGITRPDEGKVFLEGKEIYIKTPSDAMEKGIILLPEDRQKQGLVMSWGLGRNVTLPTISKYAKNGFNDEKTERDLSKRLLEEVDTKAVDIFQPASSLSGGNQQKVVVAKALSQEMKVVIMDEPTKGVDVGAKAEIYAIMGDLAKKGYAIILISSEMPEILGMSDRIVVMCNGRKTGELGRGEATQEMILELAMEKGTTGKGAAK